MKKILTVSVAVSLGLSALVFVFTQAPQSPSETDSRSQAALPAPGAPVTPETESTWRSAHLTRLVDDVRTGGGGHLAELEGAFQGILDANPHRRLEGVRSLALVPSNKLFPILSALLERDEDPQVRAESAAALEGFDSVPAASLALVAALRDADPGVREHALLSLRMHRNDRVQSALLAQLKTGGFEQSTGQAVAVFLTRYYPQLDPFDDLVNRASNP
jgi:hypothetical protein